MSGRGRKLALLVGSASYHDPLFPPLPCVTDDLTAVAEVLTDPGIGGFDAVHELLDPSAVQMRERIEAFFRDLEADDLGLLYVSGHGARLIATASEFFFVATDTGYEGVESTGVSAGFVREQLELSRATRTVAVVDCCFSGQCNLGFRSGEAGGTADPLAPRGVYVMAAGGRPEDSWVDPRPSDGPALSLFTAELVAALRTGSGDTGGDGVVDVAELTLHLRDRMRQLPCGGPRSPHVSAYEVTERIELALVPRGEPVPPSPSGEPQPCEPVVPSRREPTRPPSLTELFGYYRGCLGAASTSLAPLASDELHERYLCVAGRERLLSDDHDGIPLPEPENDLYTRAHRDGAQLWYGYPAVVLPRNPAGTPYPVPRVAPLFVRPVEIVHCESGDVVRPRGEITLHPGLMNELVGQDEAARLVREYRATWRPGMVGEMLREIHHLRCRLRLDAVGHLDAGALEPSLDTRTATSGLRNVAMIFIESTAKRVNAGVIRDLQTIATASQNVSGTALAAVLGSGAPIEAPAWTPVLPLPCNDGQRAVIDSAMTQRLTVATGPPGSGKTQLVVNLVATAIANDQTVLVTSANDRAVDEVWQRCQQLVPGAVVRAGAASPETDYPLLERAGLASLAELPKASTTEVSAAAELRRAIRRLDEVRAQVADKAARELTLLRLGRQRSSLAEAVGSSSGELSARLRKWRLRDIAGEAIHLSGTRFLGGWRRRRFLRRLAWPGGSSAQVCAALGAWARNEARWERERADILGLHTDAELRQALADKAEQVRGCSQLMLTTMVRQNAGRGRHLVAGLGAATPIGREVRTGLLPVARGWAVTNQSLGGLLAANPAVFDLVIVDDVNGCSIPEVIPALYRAKRALVVGDPMQVAPAVTLGARQETTVAREHRISASWLERRRLNYRRHSAFAALAEAAGTELTLDEHYRCHPDIAAVAGEQFYRRGPTVLADGHRRRQGRAITWVPVTGDARPVGSASWHNPAEIAQVDVEVRALLAALPPDAEIAVTTPFTAQRESLAGRWAHERRVRVGTVPEFQGREADAMVISLTASPTMPCGTVRWLGGDRNLWNVAITRARSRLVLVGDRDLWARLGPIGPVLVAAAEGSENGSSVRIAAGEDDLAAQLLDWLSVAHPRGRITLSEVLCGYRVDAVVHHGRRGLPVLLDRGYGADVLPSRHLRRQFELSRLIMSEAGVEATRLPAWRLFDSAT